MKTLEQQGIRGKTAYYEWRLATYTEGGTTDGKKH